MSTLAERQNQENIRELQAISDDRREHIYSLEKRIDVLEKESMFLMINANDRKRKEMGI